MSIFKGQPHLTGALTYLWQKNILNCKSFNKLNSNLNSDIISGSFRITAKFKNPKSNESIHKSMFDCGINVELPEIISRYLGLNLSFIKPNDDFDGTIGWINGTDSGGPLKMVSNDQVDYVINNIFMNDIWYPNLIVTSTALKENYGISFLMKKQTARLSLANYLNIFNFFIWTLIFVSILVIGIVHGTILNIKFKEFRSEMTIKKLIKLIWNLIFDYFNLLMCKQ